MTDHDSLYHRIFSHPPMVADLLREFLDPSLLAELDLSRMERQNVKYYAYTGERREGDVAWKIPTRKGIDIVLLLLLEFQYKIRRWMSVRVQVYSGLALQQWINEQKLGKYDLLPPILPIVLYNGKKRWDAPTHMRPLIHLPEQSPLWHFQPEVRYYVVDEGKYSEGYLKERDSLTALLCRLEHPSDPTKLPGLTGELIVWFKGHPDFEPLKPLFVELIGRWLANIQGRKTSPRMPNNLLEAKTMLQEYTEQWEKKWKQEGRQEGEATVLLRLLQRRFGEIPHGYREKISKADLPTLEEWSLRILDARSLEDVFDNQDGRKPNSRKF